MKNQRYFETVVIGALREATVIQKMLDDLEHTMRLLDVDIAAEEDRTQVLDVFDRQYSMLAKSPGARRDNMKVTVAAPTGRLRAIAITAPMQEAA